MLSMSLATFNGADLDEVLLPPSVVFRLNHSAGQHDTTSLKKLVVVADYQGSSRVEPARSVCRHTTVCKLAEGVVKREPAEIKQAHDIQDDASALALAVDQLARTASEGRYSELAAWYVLRTSADDAQTAGLFTPISTTWAAFRHAHKLPEFVPVKWYTPAYFQSRQTLKDVAE